MKGGLVLTEEQITSLMAYLTEREPDIKAIVERLEKALAATKEEEEAEPRVGTGEWTIAWISPDGEIERHGAT